MREDIRGLERILKRMREDIIDAIETIDAIGGGLVF